MLLEIGLVVTILLGVFIVFYRQAIEQYNILQIEAEQINDLPKLLSERTPLVIRGMGQPKLFTPDVLKTNTRLQKFPVGNKVTLGDYITSPKPVQMTKKASVMLAKEAGLSVWGEHMWFSKLFSYSFLEHIHVLSAEAQLGDLGLRKTTGRVTLLYPTAGAFEVTLMTEHQQKYLPASWRGRFPELFTAQDTPLVGEIKYITIKLRPGNVLCLPTHWFYSVRAVEKDKPALWARFVLDDPISYVASRMEGSLDA